MSLRQVACDGVVVARGGDYWNFNKPCEKKKVNLIRLGSKFIILLDLP